MRSRIKYFVGIVFLGFFLLWDIINTGGVSSHSDYSFIEESSYNPSRLYNRISDYESFKSFDYNVEKHLTYADEYKRYIVENGERNQWICMKAIEEVCRGKKVLILVVHFW